MHCKLARALPLSLVLLAPPALAQNLNGGQQSLMWPADCATDVTFTNNTFLPLAGLWINVGVVGANDPPEIEEITVHDSMGGKTWDVDDDEDLDNSEASDSDVIDSSPSGPGTSNGWHRVQARSDADVLAVGASFTLRLCAEMGNSVSGRTVFLIPITQKTGQVGGDLGPRVTLPIAVNRLNATGFVSIGSGAPPPGSTDFALAMANAYGAVEYRKVVITPPPGVTVVNAVASSGGTFESSQHAIVWPTPIPPGCIEALNVSLDSLSGSTTTAFTPVLKMQEKP